MDLFAIIEQNLITGIKQAQQLNFDDKDKKDFVLKLGCKVYDDIIDKNLNLPWYIDELAKTFLIPGMINFLVKYLKSRGHIK